MATLQLKGINKIYPNKVQAVFDFNMEINDKEFVVFVGPSGCGKSTTLRMIAGLEDITSGELYIDGQLMNSVAPKDRNIAMVFQNYALYPHMSVYENMKFALKLRKVLMPIYENDNDVLSINEDNKKIAKDLKKINRKLKRKDGDSVILNERRRLYQALYKNENEKAKILRPLIGIDYLQISSIEKQIELLNKEINQNQSIIDAYKDKEDVSLFVAMNEQRNILIEKLKNRIEYLKNNEIPLTELRKLTNLEMDIEINKVAESIDLTRYLYRKPAALSGGQRQRVALGRAIVRKPRVFLMDEPLSNLDAKLRVQTRAEITRIHQQVGSTTVYVTHDQTEAMTMADRIVVMKDGYIQQIGTPDEVYDNPVNMFVAGFIGAPAMNFIKGKIINDRFEAIETHDEIEETTQKVFGLDKFSVELNAENKKRLESYENQEVFLGIRPEKLCVNEDKGYQKINCECFNFEQLGHEAIIYTYVLGQKIISKIFNGKKIKVHDKFDICLSNDDLYFFDNNGKRIY